MNGETLYEMWAMEMFTQGISVDGWDDLSMEDAASWDAIAAKVVLK